MSAIRRAAPWLVYPTVVGGSLAIGAWALGRGWQPEVVVALAAGFSLALIAALERVMPYARQWSRSHADTWTDGAHSLLSMVLVPEGLRLLLAASAVGLSGWISQEAGASLWPSSWSVWMQLLLVVCLTDLLQYWLHRASHRWEWLWRFHAIHHSAERLYWLNTGRFHPFDAALTYLASLPLLWILGCPEQTIALYLILATSHGPLQHSNIDMRLGPLNWVLCQAELHRWHHSPLRGERDMNYGAITILWDVVFGTRFLPARRPPEALGIGSMPYFPRKFGPQLLAPLRWRSLPRLPEAQNDHPEAI